MEGLGVGGIAGGKTVTDIPGHELGVFGGKPDMGILFVVVSLFLMVVVMLFFGAEEGDALGGIDGRLAFENVLHKFFQSCAGENDQVRGFRGLDLADIEGVVGKAGNLLCDQPGDGDVRTLAKGSGKFIDRQGSCSYLGRGRVGAAGKEITKGYRKD